MEKLLVFIAATSLINGHAEAQKKSSVPFVGCNSDGQVGPQSAPMTENTPILPTDAGRRLAYYAATGAPGVLAPRGWHCFGLYGSSGSVLVVAPRPLTSNDFFGRHQFKTNGPAVDLTYNYGGTSGRWAVANAIARYFPHHRTFIQRNFQGLEVGPLPSGPYPQDRLMFRTEKLVRYITPPTTKGAGTEGNLSPSTEPVQGFAMLVNDPDGPDLLRVNVRLPPEQRGLAETIIENAELQVSR